MDTEQSRIHLPGHSTKIPHLANGIVHIWCLPLDLPMQERERCFSLLSIDEKTRAGKFYFETARDHFIAGRGLLRILLGGYLNVEPASIQFGYEPQGKPVLKEGDLSIQFNVSHSEGLGVIALCLGRRLGVDIEWLRPMADMDDLAQRFFTEGESALIESLSGDDKQALFYKIWTGKESYLKAVGAGLFLPLDQVEVKFEAGGAVHLVSNGNEELNDWQLRMFCPQSSYQCAVCVEGGDMEIVFQPQDQ